MNPKGNTLSPRQKAINAIVYLSVAIFAVAMVCVLVLAVEQRSNRCCPVGFQWVEDESIPAVYCYEINPSNYQPKVKWL